MAVRTNISKNPSFETSEDWTADDPGTISVTRDTTTGWSGSCSLKLTNISAFSTGYQYAHSPTGTSGYPCSPSTQYTVSFYTKNDTVDSRINNDFYVEYYTSGGAVISQSWSSTWTPGSTGWERKSMVVTTPSNAAYLAIGVSRNDNGFTALKDNLTWYDAFLIEPAFGVFAYFDGSTTDTSSVRYDWTGTAHASSSQAFDIVSTAVGTNTESDSPLAFGRQKRRTLGVLTETDSPISVGKKKRKSINTATETETPVALTRVHRRALGVVGDTSSALTFGVRLGDTVAPATEDDSAVALTKSKRKAVSPITETETANTIRVNRKYPLSPATEANEARAVLASLVVYRFEPPTYSVPVVGPLLTKRPRFAIEQSISVVRVGGTLTAVHSPTTEQLRDAGVEGEDYFLGGRVYENIPHSISNELELAGFNTTPME